MAANTRPPIMPRTMASIFASLDIVCGQPKKGMKNHEMNASFIVGIVFTWHPKALLGNNSYS